MGVNHSEYKRDHLKLEASVAYSNLSKGTFKTRWLILNNNELSYSYAPGLVVIFIQVRKSTLLNKTFHIFDEDSERRSISLQCIDSQNVQRYWGFIWSNTEEYNTWVTRIKYSLRPIWEDPLQAKICKECARPFNMLRRQHHCRRCGKAVCGRHSKHRVPMPDMAYFGFVRVCNGCFNRTVPGNSSTYFINGLVRSTGISGMSINS
jgi:hypothetical protein